MKLVKVAPQAERDLGRLASFLAPKNPPAAKAAVIAMQDAILSLSEFPERGHPVGPTILELFVAYGRDGYVVRYRVGVQQVTITRVFHGKERR